MKVSYKVLKSYLPNLPAPEEVAQKLVMHTAEVDDIIYEWENLENVYVWEVIECEKHTDSDKLNCTKVKVWDSIYPIVCWAPNVKVWIKVPVALVWAKLAPDFVIAKTKIRWEVSEWMICSLDELWLISERQEWIWEMPVEAPNWASLRDYLWKTDAILDIDNKAINHRPDMFSHLWVIRELSCLYWEDVKLDYENVDFSNLDAYPLENKIPEFVNRYSALKISWVKNIETPEYIKQVLSANDCDSKGLLIDITNYSLYFYWQPLHAFDADKIDWKIIVRFAGDWEWFTALDDNYYELSKEDIVIADESKILALWWVIWWKSSAVTDDTTSIVLESANFDQAILRKTWRTKWVRTDALNVFEKDIPADLVHYWTSLAFNVLKSSLPDLKTESYSDSYEVKQKEVTVPLDFSFINSLIWKNYSTSRVEEILEALWLNISWSEIKVPFFRTDISRKADIAEEVARIEWYNNVESTLPRIEVWAVSQSDMYKFKKDVRNFFVSRGFYEMYNYSFVGREICEKMNVSMDNLIPLKNFLSEDASHMRWDLITNLMNSLEENIRDEKNLKLFEIEKIYKRDWDSIEEKYSLAWVYTKEKEDILYYDILKILSDFYKSVWISKYSYSKLEDEISFVHNGRTSNIVIRWKSVWIVWEIHPLIAKRFDVNSRVAFFEIDVEAILPACYDLVKAKEISVYQENNFDMAFLVDKSLEAKKIKSTIQSSDNKYISNVELIDIYENEEKIPWKRSLAFKIYISSLDWTLWDDFKSELIKTITSKVEKVWWILRC